MWSYNLISNVISMKLDVYISFSPMISTISCSQSVITTFLDFMFVATQFLTHVLIKFLKNPKITKKATKIQKICFF